MSILLGSFSGKHLLAVGTSNNASGETKILAGLLDEADESGTAPGPSERHRVFSVDQLGFETAAGEILATLKINSVDLPGVLVVNAEAGLRLRSLDEIDRDRRALAALAESQADQAAREARARGAEILAELRDAAHAALARRTVALAGDGFFGVTGVLAAQGSVVAVLGLDLDALAAAATGGATGREVLRASLEADLAVVAGSVRALAHLRLTCIVRDRAAEAFSLLSDIALPPLPNVPPLRFDFPAVDFAGLRLPGLALPDPTGLLDVPVPLPTLGGRLPLDVVWTVRPEFTLAATGAGLAIGTRPGSGRVQTTGGTPVARFSDLVLTADTAAGAYAIAGTIEGQGTVRLLDAGRATPGCDAALPVEIDVAWRAVDLTFDGRVDLGAGSATATLRTVLGIERVLVRAKDDPALVLALAAEIEAATDSGGLTRARVTRLEIVEPDPVVLIAAAAEAATAGVLRLVGLLKLPGDRPDLPGMPPLPDLTRVLQRITDILAASLRWAARAVDAGSGLARALAGIGEAAVDLLAQVLDLIRRASERALAYVAVEVRLDARSYALRQILITPVQAGGTAAEAPAALELAGLHVTLPGDWSPTLLIDLSGPLLAALLVAPRGDRAARLATDLWLKREGAPVEGVRDTDAAGRRPTDGPLVRIDLKAKDDEAFVLAALDGGEMRFCRLIANPAPAATHALTLPNGDRVAILAVGERPVLAAPTLGGPTDAEADIRVEAVVDPAKAGRLLPFLGTPKTGATEGGLAERLGQFVRVRRMDGAVQPVIEDGLIALTLPLQIVLDGLTSDVDLKLDLDLSRLTARVKAGDKLVIRGREKQGDLFGLTYVIKAAPGKTRDQSEAAPDDEPDQDGTFPHFVLALAGGNPRLALAEGCVVELFYARLGIDGRGLVFKVREFAVGQGTFDVVAEVDPDEPVTMPGVRMPFRFREGRLVVERGAIQTFTIAGTGQLPPELVGEANCTVAVTLGADRDGRLAVLAAGGTLSKPGEPIVCHATCFTLTATDLGFDFRDFGREGGYQFFFLVTGSIVFTPPGDAFANSFLKNLRGARITLTKAPLGRDMSLLARAIDIRIPLDPKVTITLFEIFRFELRGFGFHPRSEAFAPDPALSLSGQAQFLPSGDTISARIDFHEMWIAPPKGGPLPRVRFDGLAVSLSLKGAGTIEGTAVTVDGNLPSLFAPKTLPPQITPRGFLASGRLNLQGWASMSAAMGFLTLTEQATGANRHAFFVYGQHEDLAEPIPTPIKELYLRRVGFGFGFRYTLAGLRRADAVTTPQALIQVLDDVSRVQNDLARFTAWEPETSGDRITLALAGMVSMNAASPSGQLSEKEKELPNPLLFDVSAALRSDLTFLMTIRAWVSTNYHTIAKAPDRDDILRRPPLRGYLYLSAPRQQLLARAVSDPQGYIGSTPKLPETLVEAMKRVRWSATLYVTPGLFHAEFGWPYELEFAIQETDFALVLQGGLVLRIEDGAMLYGIAFRARGFAQIGGQVGGRSLGASVVARADFALDSKLIAYLSAPRLSDTLFYGSVAFSVTVRLAVRVWLEIDLRFTTLSLSVSFALSLTISVALEVALGPSLVAGRGAASVAVSAFGRTLSLAVGFGFNTGALEEARARVARFLALGLTAAIPDPAQGLAPLPAARPSPAPDLDREAEIRAGLGEIAAGTPATGGTEPIPVPAQARPIGDPRFWAVLFAVPAQPGAYVMQLVPRDHTETGIADLRVGETDATFYPLLGDGEARYEFTFDDAGVAAQIRRLVVVGGVPQEVPASQTATTAGDAVVALAEDGSGRTLSLRELLNHAFLRATIHVKPDTGEVVRSEGAYGQPRAETIAAGTDRIRATDADMREAGAAFAALSFARAHARAIEERRSSIIASVCASAKRIAEDATATSGGGIAWPARLPPGTSGAIDARDLGLTFLVHEQGAGSSGSDDTLDGVFFPANAAKPAASRFTVKAVGGPAEMVMASTEAAGEPEAREVHLFNPPSRFFDRANPRLAGLSSAARPQGVVLDWNLEPGWGDAPEFWSDPEFHLAHYRIERVFLTATGVAEEIPPFSTTVKACAPLTPSVEGGVVTWRRLRPPAQFVDEFSDLPPARREALLQRDAGDARTFARSKAAFDDLAALLRTPDEVRILYTVVPVDISGKSGVGTPIETSVTAPSAPSTMIGRAELVVDYARFPGLPGRPLRGLWLHLDDLADRLTPEEERQDGERPQRLPYEGSEYHLKVRRDPPVTGGLFGADALTRALERPGPDAFGWDEAADRTFTLRLRWQAGPAERSSHAARQAYRRKWALAALPVGGPGTEAGTPWFELSAPGSAAGPSAFERLAAALGIAAGGAETRPGSGTRLEAVRVAVQRRVRAVIAPDGTVSTRADPSPWLPAETRLRIGDEGADTLGRALPRPVDAVVEGFEHPVVSGYRPLHFGDLAGEAGRLLVDHPAPAATLAGLAAGRPGSLVSLRDGERRVATRVRWNAVPAAAAADGTAEVDTSPDLIGGWDVFEIDLATGMAAESMVGAARPVARVLALDPRLARIDPPGIDDFGAVEAYYPSETRRLEASAPGIRRAAWFSPAESLLAWPVTPYRRSLGLAAEETELAALLRRGRPDRIKARWSPDSAESFRKAGIAPPAITLDGSSGGQPDEGFTVRDVAADATNAIFTSGLVMTLAYRLVMEGVQDAARPGILRDVSLDLVGMLGSGETGRATLSVDLSPDLHPVLADIVDALRWDEVQGGGGARYRRFRPVLEPAPPTEAKTLADLLDERPAARDPYGWAVLRTLGLAQGLRLFDMAKNDYEERRGLLERVDAALRLVRRRYHDVFVGAPFVEVMSRADGLYQVASFDGGAPRGGDARSLVDREALALVQVSLRPVAERIARDAGFGTPEPKAVYAALRLEGAQRVPSTEGAEGGHRWIVALDAARLPADATPLLVELVDAVRGFSAGRVRRLARSDDAGARDDLAPGESVDETVVLDVTPLVDAAGEIKPLVFALARITSSRPIDPTHLENAVSAGKASVSVIDAPVAYREIAAPLGEAGDAVGDGIDPFERFPDLSKEALALLLEDAGTAPTDAAKDDGGFGSFLRRAARRFPDGMPARDKEDRRDFLARWPGLARRFLAHGPAGFAMLRDPDQAPFALATIPRPDPFRVRPDREGRLGIVLVHKERFARRRRYLVRPFSRYENLLAAWDAVQRDGGSGRLPLGWAARRSLADSVTGLQPATDARRLPAIDRAQLHRFAVDIVTPRTEPLSPPVLLSAGRLDVGEGTARRPGRMIEVVAARHHEEQAAEANATVADGLQFEHVAFGFWREFAHPVWARGLQAIAGASIDLLPPLASSVDDPGPLSFTGPTFDDRDRLHDEDPGRPRQGLPARLPEGWRGITALRTSGAPHFYRVHVAAFAAAGVVVSDPVAALIPEGSHRLAWPWATRDDPRPTWTVERDDAARTARVLFDLPLVRFLDGMPLEEREAWGVDAGADLAVFGLPDPGVAYELSTRLAPVQAGADAVRAGDVAPEVEFLALPGGDAASGTEAAYAARRSGTRFDLDPAPADGQTALLGPVLEGRRWRLTPALRRLPVDPVAAHAPLTPTSLEPLLAHAGDFWLDAAAWRDVQPFAPTRGVTLTLRRPDVATPPTDTDWAPFQAQVRAARAVLEPYAGAGAAAIDRVVGHLRDFEAIADAQPADRLARWLALAGGPAPNGEPAASFADAGWPAGLPDLPAVPSVSLDLGGAWALEIRTAPFVQRSAFIFAMASAKPRDGRTRADVEAFALPLYAALWAHDRRDLAAADRAGFAGFAPVFAAVPEDLGPTAAEVSAAASTGGVVAFVRSVILTIPDGLDVRVADGPLFAPFSALLTALATAAPIPGSPGLGLFPALAALARIERAGHGEAALPLPDPLAQTGSSVMQALQALAAADARILVGAPGAVGAVGLRRPPVAAELAALRDAAHHLPDQEAAGRLLALIERLAADQVFGPARRPALRARRGFLDPIDTVIERGA